MTISVARRCQIPDDAAAIVVTVAATGTTAAGFATLWASGSPQPTVSNLNWQPGEMRANTAIVALGETRGIDAYTNSTADLVVDVVGAFTADGPGRMVTLTPSRLLDTRTTGRPAADDHVIVPLPAGVPADAAALAVTVTVTNTATAGFVTAHRAGDPTPLASILNIDAAGQTRSVTTFVPASSAGIELYTSAAADIVVDHVGYLTGVAAATTTGRYVPVTPHRILDTRPTGRLNAGSTVTVTPNEPGGAIVANWTMVNVANPGFVELRAATQPRNGTSALNAAAGDVVASLAVTHASSAGVSAFTSTGTGLVADMSGYFIGSRTPHTPLPYAGISPYGQIVPGPRSGAERRVLYVGDSMATSTDDALAADLPGWGFKKLTFGGTAPCDWVQQAATTAATFRPDIVVFSFLGNNITECTGRARGDALIENYQQALTELCAAVPPARCVAVGQPVVADIHDPAMPRAGDFPTARYHDLAVAGMWGFVDAGSQTEAGDGSYTSDYRVPDGVHFNDVGAARYAQAIATYLLSTIG